MGPEVGWHAGVGGAQEECTHEPYKEVWRSFGDCRQAFNQRYTGVAKRLGNDVPEREANLVVKCRDSFRKKSE